MQVILALVLLATHAAASDDPVCENIHARACSESPKGESDPSGRVYSHQEMKSKVAAAKSKFAPRLKELVQNAVATDPEFSAAIAKVLKCQKNCTKNSEQALSALIERDVMGGEGRFAYKNLTVTDIYDLVQHPAFEKLRQPVEAEYRELLAPKASREEIADQTFPAVKRLLIERIVSIQMDEPARQRMVASIDRVTAKMGECGLLKLDQLYPPVMYLKKDEIAVCDATVARVNSKITLAAMLAHELAHSIDPCHSREAQFPIPKLIECLRGKNSVGALVLKPGLDCSSDQVNETFADWLAAEVVPRFIEQNYKGAGPERLRAAYVNALWRTCNQSAQMPQYPNGILRGNALLGANPRVREQMRCAQKSQYVYCEAPSVGNVKASSSTEVTR